MSNRTLCLALVVCTLVPRLQAYSLDRSATVQTTNPVSSLKFSPDSRRLFVDTYEDEHFLYDLEKKKQTKLDDPGMYIAFSPHSRYLYSIDASGKAYNIYDVENNRIHYSIDNPSKTNSFNFSPDGKSAILSFRDNTARYIDIENKKPINTITHKNQIKFADFTPDARCIISASWEDNVIGVFSIKENKVVKAFTAPVKSDIRISANGRFLILGPSGDRQGIISIVDLNTMTQNNLDADDELPFLYLSPDSRHLAITERQTKDSDKPIDAADVLDLSAFSLKATTTVTLYNLETKHADEIFTGPGWLVCTFSSDGKYLLINSSLGDATDADTEAKSATVFNVSTVKQALVVTHDKKLSAACFSPDGRSLLTASDDKTLRIADIASAKTVNTLNCPQKPVSAAFTPSGDLVMVGMDDQTTSVYDPKTKKTIATLKAQPVGLFELALEESLETSPDGTYLAALEKDTAVALYRVLK